MRWALNPAGMRINASTYGKSFLEKKILRTPCCNQRAIYIPSHISSRRSYFRHHNLSLCPYAITPEYNLALHWEIVDDLDENLEMISFRWRVMYDGIIPGLLIELMIGLKLIKIKSEREKIFRDPDYPECRRRTDYQILRNCFEIQCSPISNHEVKIRETTYQKNRCKTRWILGFSADMDDTVLVMFPFQASKGVQKRMKEYLRKNRRQLKRISDKMFQMNGLKLKKWQIDLINSNNVVGIYHKTQFFLNFKVDTIFTHVPKLKFTPAHKKICILKYWN